MWKVSWGIFPYPLGKHNFPMVNLRHLNDPLFFENWVRNSKVAILLKRNNFTSGNLKCSWGISYGVAVFFQFSLLLIVRDMRYWKRTGYQQFCVQTVSWIELKSLGATLFSHCFKTATNVCVSLVKHSLKCACTCLCLYVCVWEREKEVKESESEREVNRFDWIAHILWSLYFYQRKIVCMQVQNAVNLV